MVELWGENLKKRYSNSRCSWAYIFYLGYYIMLILVPLYAAYASHGFWKKEGLYREQPNHTFEQRFVVLLEGETPGSIIGWSTMSEFNNMLSPSQRRLPQISTTSIDQNVDSLPDEFQLNITMPLQSTEKVHRAMLWMFFNSKLTQLSRMEMSSMAVVQQESFYPGERLIVNGDLLIEFINPISSISRRTDYDSQVLAPKNITSISDVLPETVYRRYVLRNDTLTIRHRVPPLWKSSSSASSFTLQVDLKLPTQDIPYIPGAAEVLKFAWVQYISLFILLAYFMSFVRAFVFRYQVVETFVASDTRPPQKVHQF